MDTGKPHKRIRKTCKHCKRNIIIRILRLEILQGFIKRVLLFVPSPRSAAARGEEAISIPELKMAVAKALRVLIAKLYTKSQPNEDIIVQACAPY